LLPQSSFPPKRVRNASAVAASGKQNRI
jgi:hypothetical protein